MNQDEWTHPTRKSYWCVACACGWQRDAFDASAPEEKCREQRCNCHSRFWKKIELMPENDRRAMWGDK